MALSQLQTHVSIDTADLAAPVSFYRALIGVEPALERHDYARFDVSEPPLVLGLNAVRWVAAGSTGALNHLGVRFEDEAGLDAARRRLEGLGGSIEEEPDTECCYARLARLWATFLRVQSRLATLHDGERLGAWLGVVARHVLADHGRARRHATVSARDAEPGDAALEHPAAQEADEGGAALTAAVAGWIEVFLGRLDADDAALLRAVELEGRAQVDVARELGLSRSGARSRVQRARARLRRELEACCRFAFDARGNLTQAIRRPGSTCDCDS